MNFIQALIIIFAMGQRIIGLHDGSAGKSAVHLTQPNAQVLGTETAITPVAQSAKQNDEDLLKVQAKYNTEMVTKQKQLKDALAGTGQNTLSDSEKVKMKNDRDTYNLRITTIKDEKKKKTVEAINAKMIAANKNMVVRMSGVLDLLTNKLRELNIQLGARIGQGADMEKAKIYSLEAESAIITAQTAVLNQWGRVYVPQIPDEEVRLKSSITALVKEMSGDLTNTQDLVHKAVEMMTLFHKEIYSKKATPSGAVISPGHAEVSPASQ